MTTTKERADSRQTHGDDALDIINRFRSALHDQTRVEQLDAEFPSYARSLGAHGVALMNLSDNDAGSFTWRGAAVGATEFEQQGISKVTVPSPGNHARATMLVAELLDMNMTVASSRRTSQGQTMLHPYDNLDVIAGQGTIVDDLLTAQPDTKHIVLPVGGGGLLAGVLRRLDERQRADITVHAVQAAGSNSLSHSLATHELTAADNPNQRYGGSAVQRIGSLAFWQCLRSSNVHVIDVPDNDVDELSGSYIEDRKHLLRTDTPNYEPITLLAVAALKQLQHLTSPVTVLGTGQNNSIYPPTVRRSHQLPF